jgi:hypothetical protein
MPLGEESSGGAPLLDAVLYDHILVTASEALQRAHLCPSDLARRESSDGEDTGRN